MDHSEFSSNELSFHRKTTIFQLNGITDLWTSQSTRQCWSGEKYLWVRKNPVLYSRMSMRSVINTVGPEQAP